MISQASSRTCLQELQPSLSCFLLRTQAIFSSDTVLHTRVPMGCSLDECRKPLPFTVFPALSSFYLGDNTSGVPKGRVAQLLGILSHLKSTGWPHTHILLIFITHARTHTRARMRIHISVSLSLSFSLSLLPSLCTSLPPSHTNLSGAYESISPLGKASIHCIKQTPWDTKSHLRLCEDRWTDRRKLILNSSYSIQGTHLPSE